jgi:putative sigma-54 modulation protein
MQISIVGRHVEITDAIEDYIGKRLQKLKKYFPMLMDVHIILFTQKYLQGADITIQANNITIHGEEKSKDLYASIDMVIDKLDAQLKKHKDRVVRHHQKTKRPGKEVDLNLNISVYEKDIFESFSQDKKELPSVHSKRITLKPMFLEEAIMQLDLISDDFLIFLDEETEKIKVVYRQQSGDYRLIEPEY